MWCSRGLQAKCFGKKWLGWKLENYCHWKFEIFIFKQSLNLQVFGDLDLNVVFHLLSNLVGK
jgi:hypothetical protein